MKITTVELMNKSAHTDKQINAQKLATHIKDCFLHEDRYQMHKSITEFKDGNIFLGDYFQFLIYEPTPKAPIIYNTGGSFDLVSKKAPDRAQVFQDGELLIDIDFAEWTQIRSGAMDAIMMGFLPNKQDSKILYYGAGGIAQWSLRILKQLFPDIAAVDYHNKSGGSPKFEEVGASIGINANYVDEPDHKNYDCIFMHTSADSVILEPHTISGLKAGALITHLTHPSPNPNS